VAVNRTQPHGRVLGVDLIPAQPPKGVSTIQGNFLSPEVQEYIRDFLRSPNRGRPRPRNSLEDTGGLEFSPSAEPGQDTEQDTPSLERPVDVVLSDMSAPWHQTSGFWKRSLSNPYRMMNTSGVSFRDHAGSMVSFQFPVATLRALTRGRTSAMLPYASAQMF
jgi:21S rRNA (uridine2791-2'-O)-methyltransferase